EEDCIEAARRRQGEDGAVEDSVSWSYARCSRRNYWWCDGAAR
ncbi:unnamed protein product, partial [Urochloa humidicola]